MGQLHIILALRGRDGSSLFTTPYKRTRGGGGLKLPRSRERNMYTAPNKSKARMKSVYKTSTVSRQLQKAPR